LERIKDLEGQLAQKQKTIEGREQEIKHLKDDNRYLELGNEELKEKMETLQTVMQDIDDINRHLKKEKTYLDEKRKEQERLR
jgi:regulator of replication initiation timing